MKLKHTKKFYYEINILVLSSAPMTHALHNGPVKVLESSQGWIA